MVYVCTFKFRTVCCRFEWLRWRSTVWCRICRTRTATGMNAASSAATVRYHWLIIRSRARTTNSTVPIAMTTTSRHAATVAAVFSEPVCCRHLILWLMTSVSNGAASGASRLWLLHLFVHVHYRIKYEKNLYFRSDSWFVSDLTQLTAHYWNASTIIKDL